MITHDIAKGFIIAQLYMLISDMAISVHITTEVMG